MRSAVLLAAAFGAWAGSARASDLGSDGRLAYASDAIATYGFESDADLAAEDASFLDWATGSTIELTATLAASSQLAQSVVSDDSAIEGTRLFEVSPLSSPGFAIFDAPTFASIKGQRVSVSMWGRAVGAEPVMMITYEHKSYDAGPFYFANVVAARTGRETSDGWVEYSTGPIDGSLWGHAIHSITLSARVAAYNGDVLLIDYGRAPQNSPVKLDVTVYAQIDGIEIRPEPGPLVSGAACTHATEASACGAEATCIFGTCVDAAFIWGAPPRGAGHQSDLLDRLSFVMQHLHGARNVIANGPMLTTALSALANAQGPQELYRGAQSAMSTYGHNGHTTLGYPASYPSTFYPFAYDYSSGLGACFAPVVNDIAGDTTTSYVVRKHASLGYFPSIQVGDVLTSIDGESPDAWLDEVAPAHEFATPDDPAQYPAERATLLADLITQYAKEIVVTRCTAGTCVAEPPIEIASKMYTGFESTGYVVGGQSFSCAQRWISAVPSAPSTYDSTGADTVAFATADGVTSIQFDGFEPASAGAWEQSMSSALAAGGPYLFDARTGHGGRIDLGRWFLAQMRDNTNPSSGFAMPRGAIDDPDPSWLFDPTWDSCYDDAVFTLDLCDWGSNGSFGSTDAPAKTGGAKIAWLDSLDVSMNDIAPRILQGLPNVRIFAPYATSGSFGEISSVPPIMSTWDAGTIQVTDIRVGSTPADARTQPWNSGKGTVPDQVVAQTLSDLLAGKDTMLAAAQAWLVMP